MCAEDGQLHELDLLVCATSFKADAFMRPMGIVGVTLADAWDPRPNAYRPPLTPRRPDRRIPW